MDEDICLFPIHVGIALDHAAKQEAGMHRKDLS
jgi:hypothetical protein